MDANELVLMPKSELLGLIRDIVAGELQKVPYYSRNTPSDEYLTREQAAELMNITPTTLTKYVKEGRITHGGTERKYLFKRSDVDAFIFKTRNL